MISLLCAVLAATQVYRLELTDEVPYIVGQDGVKRQVCLVDPDQYAVMTGQVAQVWKSLNSTDDGRRKLHGKRSQQIVSDDGEKVTVYEDGYRHVEKAGRKTQAVMDSFSGRNKSPVKAAVRKLKNHRISDRHQKMLDELEERRKAAPKEITVEHDALTGKDTVK